MTIETFHNVSNRCSKAVTSSYSTSFSSAIKMLHSDLHVPIYNIYGMVRLADEIVDTFHNHDKEMLLKDFKQQTFDAIDQEISLNPILNSFQQTVNKYGIDHELIHAFFDSMESDLTQNQYNRQAYDQYIYGSAEVVGLMCLYVFCNGNQNSFMQLQYSARALGAAFQKVNFLRDIKADYNDLSRTYFPGCNFNNFTLADKREIESEIETDFKNAYAGIMRLPLKARFGVYVAYKYYYSLFGKIKSTKPTQIMQKRIRIGNHQKAFIFLLAGFKNQLRLI